MALPTEINLTLDEAPDGSYDWKTYRPTYTPLYLGTYEGRATGAAAPFGLTGVMSTDRSVSGVRSMKINLTQTNVPAGGGAATVCGSAGFGGSITLPELVPVGDTLWMRLRVYIPSTTSLSHAFTSTVGQGGVAAGCGGANDDGNPTGTKFLTFDPNSGTSRIYTHIETSYRGAPYGFGRIQIEAGAGVDNFTERMPLDQWFTLEMAALVHQSSGYVRVWLNGILIGELTGIRTVADGVTGLDEVRIGDYFNGTPWTDGSHTNYFYLDDLILATSKAGFGVPDGRDAANNPMIGAAATLIDFQ